MVGGIAYIISAVYSSITGTGEAVDLPNKLLGLVWALGAICGWLAFIQLKGTGENTIARSLSFVPIIGLCLALIFTAYEMFTAGSDTFSTMVAIGLLLELVGAVWWEYSLSLHADYPDGIASPPSSS
jgi:4-hydroxybenzoate polyprenyltransferase